MSAKSPVIALVAYRGGTFLIVSFRQVTLAAYPALPAAWLKIRHQQFSLNVSRLESTGGNRRQFLVLLHAFFLSSTGRALPVYMRDQRWGLRHGRGGRHSQGGLIRQRNDTLAFPKHSSR